MLFTLKYTQLFSASRYKPHILLAMLEMGINLLGHMPGKVPHIGKFKMLQLVEYVIQHETIGLMCECGHKIRLFF